MSVIQLTALGLRGRGAANPMAVALKA